MKTATLFEYEEQCFEISETDSIDGKSLRLTEKTLQELERLNNGTFLEIGRTTIKAKNFVGVIKIGDISIQVLPKIIRTANTEEHKALSASNLLKMLSYTELVPFSSPKAAVLDSDHIDLFEIFIRLFADGLENLIRHTQPREYIKKLDNLSFVKGKIRINDYINPARMHIIPCTYYDFLIDSPLNRTLKFTCHLMSRSISDSPTIRKLRSIINILDQVTLAPITVHEVDRIAFTRLNRMFEPFIRICRLFLQHSTLTLQVSHIESFSLMIPMERLFEAFIASVLKNNPVYFFGPGFRVIEQKSIGYLAKDENGRNIFFMKPDIVIEGRSRPGIIDTKYKILKPEEIKYGVSQSDMYQMHAYATKTNASFCMLLYPDMIFSQKRDFTITGPNTEIQVLIRSIPLSYNLSDPKGWAAFQKNLNEIVRPLSTAKDNIHQQVIGQGTVNE